MYWNEAPDPKQNKTQLAGIIWKPTHFFINEEFVSALYNMLVVGVDALYTLFLKDSLLICYICLPHREFDVTTVFFVSNHNPKVIFLKQLTAILTYMTVPLSSPINNLKANSFQGQCQRNRNYMQFLYCTIIYSFFYY